MEKLDVTLLLGVEQMRCSLVKLAITKQLGAEQLGGLVVKQAITFLQLS